MIETEKIYTFSTLDFWRKTYLTLSLLVSIPLSGFGAWLCFTGQFDLIFLTFPIIIAVYALWSYFAVVNRNLQQLQWLTVLAIIPFGNPILGLIMFLIYRVSKKELALSNA